MRINPISYNNTKTQHQNVEYNKPFKQKFYTTKPLLLQQDKITFKANNLDNFDDIDDVDKNDDILYHLPDNITEAVKKKYAKYSLHYLSKDDWKDTAKMAYLQRGCEKHGTYWFLFFGKTFMKDTEKFIKDIDKYRTQYNNARIEKNGDKIRQQEEDKQDLKILIGGKLYLNKKFFGLVNNNAKKIPTAIMIYDGKGANRDKLIDWMKTQISKDPRYNVASFDHENEDKTLYRLETETKYAEQRAQKYPQRTILFINNFDKLLMNDNARLKRLLGEISIENKPITIVFQTQDKSKLASPYTGNAIRIPLKLKLDKSIIPEKYLLYDRYTPYYDGFKYKIGKDEEVELFLGSFGTDDKTLWINSSSKKTIKKVLDDIRLLKQEDKFKNINKVQCYGLNEGEDNFGFYPIDSYTKDYDRIFQKDL